MLALVSLALAAGHGTEAHQARTLGENAETYWEGVRWSDPGKAAAFLPDLASRVALTTMLEDGGAKLTGTMIMQVELGVEPKGSEPRPAVVLVRLEIIDVARNRYETVNYVQHWREVGYSWVVDTTLSPLGADRPWVIGPPAAAPATVPPTAPTAAPAGESPPAVAPPAAPVAAPPAAPLPTP